MLRASELVGICPSYANKHKIIHATSFEIDQTQPVEVPIAYGVIDQSRSMVVLPLIAADRAPFSVGRGMRHHINSAAAQWS